MEASLTETAGNIRQYVLQTLGPEGLGCIQIKMDIQHIGAYFPFDYYNAEEVKEKTLSSEEELGETWKPDFSLVLAAHILC